MIRSSFARIGGAFLALGAATALVFVGTSAAHAEHEDRKLHLTRVDGSPIGTLFDDWLMVPGDKVSTTVLAHRTGDGESSLLITLNDSEDGERRPASAVEKDVTITAEANGHEIRASAAELMKTDGMLDLGRSADPVVPIDITFELPFSSTNATQLQSMHLAVVVVAADMPVSTPEPTEPTEPTTQPSTPAAPDATASVGGLDTVLPFLPNTGASVREILIGAAVLTTLGLILLGGRRKRHESVNPS
jgi:LPXTG-motif cell wall-anchored protein